MIKSRIKQGLAGGFETGTSSKGRQRAWFCQTFRNDLTCNGRRLVAGIHGVRRGTWYRGVFARAVFSNTCGHAELEKEYAPWQVSAAMFGME